MFDNAVVKKIVKGKIAEGQKKFVIYPFGENGLAAKTILNEYFGLSPIFVVDNEYAGLNPNIISLQCFKEKYDDSMCVILTIENSKSNMKMQNELLEFVDISNILNFQAIFQNEELEKRHTLLEYIVENSEKYRKSADALLNHEYENKNVVRIYTHDEIEIMEQLCYDFVKEQLENEVKEISEIKDKENTILFFAPLFESYWSNILPIMREFIKRGHKCVVMFSSIESFWWTKENINRILFVMNEIKKEGGECLLFDNSPTPKKKFAKCFFCSEYSIEQPEVLRQYANQLIAVQTTGIYKHIYKTQTRMDQLYNELESVDYYVGSDYICDWINRNNDAFTSKMLRLGYPKMDILFGGLCGEENIPEEWKSEIDGRKVILLTIEDPDIFVDIFRKYPEVCFIWRPDPEFLGTKSCNSKIEKLKSGIKHLVIDENRTYVDSFKVSTAMIGMAIFCVPINYIFTKKPTLLLDDRLNMYNSYITMSYKDEAWYKSCYVANDLSEIENFINMVVEDRDYSGSEQGIYKDEMNKGYDGKVCNRICDFFESN